MIFHELYVLQKIFNLLDLFLIDNLVLLALLQNVFLYVAFLAQVTIHFVLSILHGFLNASDDFAPWDVFLFARFAIDYLLKVCYPVRLAGGKELMVKLVRSLKIERLPKQLLKCDSSKHFSTQIVQLRAS